MTYEGGPLDGRKVNREGDQILLFKNVLKCLYAAANLYCGQCERSTQLVWSMDSVRPDLWWRKLLSVYFEYLWPKWPIWSRIACSKHHCNTHCYWYHNWFCGQYLHWLNVLVEAKSQKRRRSGVTSLYPADFPPHYSSMTQCGQ